jgi:O-acetylhomoserine (thiol)-lyase
MSVVRGITDITKACGVGEELVRISVGLEAANDILDDLGQALRAAQKP